MTVGTISCSENGMDNTASKYNTDETQFSVTTVRDFFESEIVNYMEGYSKTNYVKSSFYPGDYTPIWSNAVKKQYVDRIVIEIPILSSRNITAVCASFTGNKSSASLSAVNQSLVVEKKADNTVRTYIRSVIADNTCSKVYRTRSVVKITDLFDEDFSGIICNHSLYGKLMNVERICLGTVTKRTKTDSKLIKDIFATAGVDRVINVTKPAQSRFGGEDDLIGADGMTNEEWLENSRPGDWNDNIDDTTDQGNNNDIEFPYYIKIYCPKCNSYLGVAYMDEWGDETYYCKPCNIICFL